MACGLASFGPWLGPGAAKPRCDRRGPSLADDRDAAVHSPQRATDRRFYLALATLLRKSEGVMPASLRKDLLKALSEPKPESMATRSTLAS